MSAENVNQKKSFGSNVISAAAFPAGIAGFHGIKSTIRNAGIKNAISSLNKEGFNALNNNLKGLHKDSFSRGLTLSNKYSEYSKLAKKAVKIARRVEKGKLPLKDKILNIFRKDKVTINTLKDRSKEASEAAKRVISGKDIAVSATGEAVKSSFCQNAKNMIKKGFKDPITWAFTLLEVIPDIKNEVIPAFKEKGVIEGLKQTGKTILKAFGSMGTFVAGSSFGRLIGAAVGTLICPGAGSAVGESIGSAIGITVCNFLKGKIFKQKDKIEIVKEVATDIAQSKKNFIA